MTASAPTGAALSLQGLTVAAAAGARTPVLQGLQLQIAPGEQVALIGASGAGKSSLLLALAGAVPPLAGRLQLDGQDPWTLRPAERQRWRHQVFLAPQTPPLPPRQRVVTAVLAGALPGLGFWASLRMGWHPRPDQAAHAQQALQALDLPDALWGRVDRLSGGERQRVGLARLLVSQARLWLVDEPLSALDPSRAERVMTQLQAQARAQGRTLVCSLHQVAMARRFGRVLALQGGAVAYDGPGTGLSDALLARLYGSPTALEASGAADPAVPAPALPAVPPGAMCR